MSNYRSQFPEIYRSQPNQNNQPILHQIPSLANATDPSLRNMNYYSAICCVILLSILILFLLVSILLPPQ